MDDENLSLNKEFLEDYRKFAKQFDEIAEDLFQGHKLESLAKDFLDKHRNYIDSFPFESTTYRYPNCSFYDTVDEDYHIVEGSNQKSNNNNNNEKQVDNLMNPQEAEEIKARQVMADVFRRACQGSYLRVTYNKSRHQREENRREPVDLARYAIRYDSSHFLASYWFMISLGWNLDNITHPKERTLMGRVFKHSTLHCQRLNPADPLAYHLLGRYYYNIAQLSWIERTIAKGFLGTKVEGSYQESEQSLLHAHQIGQDWLPTGVWLARVLHAQQRPLEEVKTWIDFALSLEPKEPTSEIERQELLELRAKLKLCSN